MGADNLVQLPQWRDWREIARLMPIAVIARPGYNDRAHARRAMGWLRRFVRPADQKKHWTDWRPPALVFLRFRSEEHTSELQSLMRISYAVFCLQKKIRHKRNYSYKIIIQQ